MKRALVLAAAAGALVSRAETRRRRAAHRLAGVALNVLRRADRRARSRAAQRRPDRAVRRPDTARRERHAAGPDALLQVGSVRRRRQARADHSSARGVADRPRPLGCAARLRPDARRRRVRCRLGHGARTAVCCCSCSVRREGSPRSTFRGSTRSRSRSPVAASVPSAQAEQQLASTIGLLQATRDGRQLLADVRAFVAGINAYHAANRLPIEPWTLNDVAAMGALIGARLRRRRRRRDATLDVPRRACNASLGDERGKVVFDDLRDRNDPETPTTIAKAFPWEDGTRTGVGNATVDDGSFVPVTLRRGLVARRATTQADVERAARRSQLAPRTDTRSSSPARRSATSIRSSCSSSTSTAAASTHAARRSRASRFYVLLGRGKDYAWSLTSSTSDLIDDYAEELCGDDTHYRYQGSCREMGSFDAGTLKGAAGEPDRRLLFRTTVHGPVIGYATVGGRRVAIARKRATRGRELLSGLAWQDLNTNKPRNATRVPPLGSRLEMSFNWVYADDRDIATFSSGRLPIRPDTVDPGLPTVGNGDFEWRGLLPFARHPQAVSPASGELANWNNKPAPGFTRADDQWSYGSVQRVDLLRNGLAARRRTRSPGRLGDERGRDAGPAGRRGLADDPGGPRLGPRAERASPVRCASSSTSGGRRVRAAWTVTSTARSTIRAPPSWTVGWRRIGDAVLAPVLGPLVSRLRQVNADHDEPGANGNGFGSGWYGYVDKDLRTLLGRPVTGPFRTRFCGAGDLAACRTALWGALDATAARAAGRSGSRFRPLARRCDRGARAFRRRPSAADDALREPADVPAGHDLHGASAAVSAGCQTGVRPGRNTPGKGGWLG